jgi:hypothetical protein
MKNTIKLDKKRQLYLEKLKKYERDMLRKLKNTQHDTKS